MLENTENLQDTNAANLRAQQLILSFTTILSSSQKDGNTLDIIVQEALASLKCDHIFLSRYDEANKLFRAIAWCSSINPGNVPLEQKFMGTSYLNFQPIIINDLSSYHYRLRPAVARLGLASLVGIPFTMPNGAIGLIEAFSKQVNHFSDFDVSYLTLLAKQTAIIIENTELERECKLKSGETELLLEALKLEQASIGSLLYKMGETFSSLFNIEGIAVFGVDFQVESSPLQEVMAKGFAMSDIGRLKTLFTKKYLEQFAASPDGNVGNIIKQPLRQAGSGGEKTLYIIPIIHKRTVYGIMVFYWEGTNKDTEADNLERFSNRIISDITLILSRKHLYSNIQKISFYDILTGLANRRLFDYVLDRELKKARRISKPVSLLMVDIDFFKNVNDTFGHQTGDYLLEQCALLIKESCRGVDLPARYGGEEFAVVLPETDRVSALSVAERIREKIAGTQFHLGKSPYNITVSIGVATYVPSALGGTADSLILSADQALYQAKQLGRNVVIFAGTSKVE